MAPDQFPARVLIATPTPGAVKTRYMKGIIGVMRDLGGRGINSDFVTADGTELVTLRNDLAGFFLGRPADTHLFFVDSDMVFRPDLCARMLAADKPVIGLIYPRRSIDLSLVEKAAREGVPIQSALQLGLTWFFRREGQRQAPPPAPMLQVDWVGFGAVLIKRNVLDTMISTGAARSQPRPEFKGGRYNFFGLRAEDLDREEHTTEDVSFCRRWTRDCGGDIWAMTDDVIHIGEFGYGGSYLEVLKTLDETRVRGG
jgi:hypothetical protein